jgi:tRNA modification GTPase
LRDQLLNSLAHLEAGLDFVEEDIEFIESSQLSHQLKTAVAAIETMLDQLQARRATTEQFRIVLRGWPNVGKSSLLNAIVGRQVAIVSPEHGTTRDYVSQSMKIDGLSCLLIDTAGFESDSGDGVTTAAQDVAAQQAGDAHLELFCLDATRALNGWERTQLLDAHQANRFIVATKCDLALSLPAEIRDADQVFRTSSYSGQGVGELCKRIGRRLREWTSGSDGVIANTAVRCRQSLLAARQGLERAQSVIAEGGGEEIVAAEMHVALDELGKVVGAVYTDDILDRIFSQFCIGK